MTQRSFPVQIIFLVFLGVPLLLFMAGNLLNNDALRQAAGIGVIPFILICIGAFFANYRRSSRRSEQKPEDRAD